MANTRNYGKRKNFAEGGPTDAYRTGMNDDDFRRYMNRQTSDLWQGPELRDSMIDPNSDWAKVTRRKG